MYQSILGERSGWVVLKLGWAYIVLLLVTGEYEEEVGGRLLMQWRMEIENKRMDVIGESALERCLGERLLGNGLMLM